MRCFICFFVATICNATCAQDPTVPSAQILERLGREQPVSTTALPAAIVQKRTAPPELKLKAIVMTDSDHGIALIEVDGRRIRIRLSRPDSILNSVVIHGATYHVQNFSARSVRLENDRQTLLVQ